MNGVFENETELGRKADGANVFEAAMKQGEVSQFVNFSLGLHRAENVFAGKVVLGTD